MTHRAAFWLCLLLSAAFFGDALWGDRTLIPSGFLYQSQPWQSASPDTAADPAQQYDQLFQFYPWAHYFKESVGQGRFPLWNPYNHLGTQFFANPQTALLFPLNWLHLALPLRYSFTLICILKLALLLTGMLLWLRSCDLRPGPCLLGALVLGLSMHTQASLAFPYSNLTVLLPWMLLAARRLVRKPSTRRRSMLVLAVGMAILAGQPQSALAAFLALALLMVAELAGGKASSRGLAALAAAFGSAALLTALQWMASFEYVSESMLTEGPRIIRSGLPYLPANLINLVIPDFFGSHLSGSYWGFPGYHDAAFYSSALALLLIPLAFGAIPHPNQPTSGAGFAAALGMLSVGLLLGLPLLESLLDLPGFDLMRRNKLVFLLIFSLAELAARGAHRFCSASLKRSIIGPPLGLGWRPLMTAAALAMAAGLAFWHFQPELRVLDPGWQALRQALHSGVFLVLGLALLQFRPRRGMTVLLPLLVLIDLAPLSYGLNPRGTSEALYPKLAEVASPRQGAPPQRIYSLQQSVFPPNSGQVYGLQDVRGYDVMTPRRLFRFMQAIDPSLGDEITRLTALDRRSIHRESRLVKAFDLALQTHGDALRDYLKSESYWTVGIARIEHPRLFALLQIDRLLLSAGTPPDGFQPAEEDWPGAQAFSNPSALRARIYHRWTEARPGRALEGMLAAELEKVAVVEASLPDPPRGALPAAQPVRLLDWQPQSRRYQVESGSAAVFVEFERFSAGWRAWVDGQEQPVFPAYSLFRGIYLPQGSHEVVLEYSPSAVRTGLLISALGLLLLLIVRFGPWSKARRRLQR
ncbi:MAG: YfhO family protein [Acidobacteriota bacterium]